MVSRVNSEIDTPLGIIRIVQGKFDDEAKDLYIPPLPNLGCSIKIKKYALYYLIDLLSLTSLDSSRVLFKTSMIV